MCINNLHDNFTLATTFDCCAFGPAHETSSKHIPHDTNEIILLILCKVIIELYRHVSILQYIILCQEINFEQYNVGLIISVVFCDNWPSARKGSARSRRRLFLLGCTFLLNHYYQVLRNQIMYIYSSRKDDRYNFLSVR